MEGMFASYHDESTGNTYFACIVTDAAACCSQGIEFILTEDYSYPRIIRGRREAKICVTGVFDTYRRVIIPTAP